MGIKDAVDAGEISEEQYKEIRKDISRVDKAEKESTEIDWNKIDEKKRDSFQKKLSSVARKMRNIDYSKPGHTNTTVKAKFYAVRMLQTSLGKQDPEYTDFKYWNENGWIGKVRPWK